MGNSVLRLAHSGSQSSCGHTRSCPEYLHMPACFTVISFIPGCRFNVSRLSVLLELSCDSSRCVYEYVIWMIYTWEYSKNKAWTGFDASIDVTTERTLQNWIALCDSGQGSVKVWNTAVYLRLAQRQAERLLASQEGLFHGAAAVSKQR